MVRANLDLSDPKRRLELAIARGTSLKREFHVSLKRRGDPEPWQHLGNAIGSLLEQTRRDPHDSVWFTQTDIRLAKSVTDCIRRNAPNSTRGRYYLRAAREVFNGAEFGGIGLDQPSMAYWRHAALIWISLWHMADITQVSAEDAKNCLDFAFKPEADPAFDRQNIL